MLPDEVRTPPMTPSLLDELEKIVALRDAAEYENVYGSAESFAEADNAYKAGAASFIATHAPALADMAKRMEAAERDSKRLDWLADRNNSIGQVLLPTESVEANLHDMRAAIDHAMNAAAQEGAG